MRRMGPIVIGLALVALGPAAAQEAGEGEREAIRDLLALIADARTGVGWTAALRPHPVVRLDSLLHRHGLDLRGQDPRRRTVGSSPGRRSDRSRPDRRPDRLTLEEAVRMMERDIEGWILRSGSLPGKAGARSPDGSGGSPFPDGSSSPGGAATAPAPPR
jgi:hypothetical protein